MPKTQLGSGLKPDTPNRIGGEDHCQIPQYPIMPLYYFIIIICTYYLQQSCTKHSHSFWGVLWEVCAPSTG